MSHGQACRHHCWSLGSHALGQQERAQETQAPGMPVAQGDDGVD